MPLPTDANETWPPAHAAPLMRDVAEADAWWSGDPDKLTRIYTAAGEQRPTVAERLRFWTRPDTDTHGRKLRRIHLPAAADVASAAADMLFGDAPQYLIPEAHDAPGDTRTADMSASAATTTEDRLQELLEQNGVNSTMLQAAEIASGLGGVYLRPVWARDVADRPLLTLVHPDFAIPEFRWGLLVAVTFWRDVRVHGTEVWRHLERHHGTGVEHGLFIGTKQHLGRRVPLNQHEDTRGLDVDTDGTLRLPDELKRLLVSYVPNALPNPRHRTMPVGRADCAGAETLMDGLDDTWSSWLRDIDLGKGRIVVPDEFVDRAGRGKGATFDTDAEVFVRLNVDPGNMKDAGINIAQFEVRSEEHAQTASALFEAIVRRAGYSPQSFGLEGSGGQMTATEWDGHEDRSVRTTRKKQGYFGPAIEHALESLLLIDRHVFGNTSVEPVRPRVVWPEPDSDTLKERAESLNQIELAQAASIETKVRILNPDWEEPQVQEEVGRIKAERGIGVPTPTGEPDLGAA